MSDWYILVDRGPVKTPSGIASRWLEENHRRVASTELADKTWISTVFLGLDHSFGGGPPMVFETMVFPYRKDGSLLETWARRASTWADAEENHLYGFIFANGIDIDDL